MTAIMLDAGRRVARNGSTWKNFLARLSEALDTYAALRVRNTVPQARLRRARREVERYRRLMHPKDGREIREPLARKGGS